MTDFEQVFFLKSYGKKTTIILSKTLMYQDIKTDYTNDFRAKIVTYSIKERRNSLRSFLKTKIKNLKNE